MSPDEDGRVGPTQRWIGEAAAAPRVTSVMRRVWFVPYLYIEGPGLENMERSMRATLKRIGQAVATPRALERQALHEFDDGRLVLEHLSGDPQAFGTLVDRYQTRLLNFINRTIGDRERAEDLVQEVFIRVFRHLHRFDQTKKFSTWIYTIASNLAKNELRNRSRNPLVLFQTIKKHWEADHRPLQFEDTTARPDDLYRKRFLKEAVDQCVDQLPTHHRAVFVLRELEGKSYAEIADITGCNLGTVKSRLNRARNSFAQLIGPLLK
jgi:RNA polymerase sigma-70 factor (ECF subfamily)